MFLLTKILTKVIFSNLQEPVPRVKACHLPSNLLEWHYVLEGSENTPFAGGYNYGTLIFPTEFPFKPPSIRMVVLLQTRGYVYRSVIIILSLGIQFGLYQVYSWGFYLTW
ncbi:hypothetical protein J5N97_009265 [Dioscorea zingiberensis]|uniref:UBC core domain-containing protein n=1 Tax=Dioscorea zingiberensis TaxID=325984 RepID=A0A9D5CZ45_9LILI|nr:hypothetical protein J5N97_009265 [Dioscorea zingiberensis]